MIHYIEDFRCVPENAYCLKESSRTNDTETFRTAASHINSLGGGTLIFGSNDNQNGEPKQYIVGCQEEIVISGGQNKILGKDILHFMNCEGLILDFSGIKVLYEDQLMYGNFNKTVNNEFIEFDRYGDVLLKEDYEALIHEMYQATTGCFIKLTNCKNVKIINLNLDGNRQKVVLGGRSIDVECLESIEDENGEDKCIQYKVNEGIGYQFVGYGIKINNSNNVIIENCRIANMPSDGLKINNIQEPYNNLAFDSIKYYNEYREFNSPPEMSEDEPYVLKDYHGEGNIIAINLVSKYNGRHGLNISSGQNIIFDNCDFSKNGLSAYQENLFNSPPNCGVDLETGKAGGAENYLSNIEFKNCRFTNNKGRGLSCVNGRTKNIAFYNCLFWGSISGCVLINNPGFYFYKCTFYGEVYIESVDLKNKLLTTTDYGTKFHHCLFEDKPHPEFGLYMPSTRSEALAALLRTKGNVLNLEVIHCTFKVHQNNDKLNDEFYTSLDSNEVTMYLKNVIRAIRIKTLSETGDFNLKYASKIYDNTFYLDTRYMVSGIIDKNIAVFVGCFLRNNMFIHQNWNNKPQLNKNNGGNTNNEIIIRVKSYMNLGNNVVLNEHVGLEDKADIRHLVFSRENSISPNYDEVDENESGLIEYL